MVRASELIALAVIVLVFVSLTCLCFALFNELLKLLKVRECSVWLCDLYRKTVEFMKDLFIITMALLVIGFAVCLAIEFMFIRFEHMNYWR